MILVEDARTKRAVKKGIPCWDSHCFGSASRLGLMTTILAALILTGCGATRPSKYYQLTVPAMQRGAQGADPVPATILLGPILASHLYREDRIVYSSAGEQMGTYEYQRWAEPPTEMIQEVLLRELRGSGRYSAVYPQRSNANGDFLIRGRLYDFKEVSEGSMLARVTFELEMRDLKSGATLWTHYYSHDEPVSGKDVPSIVAALNRNVQSGLTEVLASLDRYFTEHPVKQQ
jgi:ABC-type uncharacterized transport system auxiliary subunit